MPDILLMLSAAAEAAGEHGGGHAEPMNFGDMTPGVWVAAAMATLILIALKLGVPRTIASGLDGSERVVVSAGAFLNPGQKIAPVLGKPGE